MDRCGTGSPRRHTGWTQMDCHGGLSRVLLIRRSWVRVPLPESRMHRVASVGPLRFPGWGSHVGPTSVTRENPPNPVGAAELSGCAREAAVPAEAQRTWIAWTFGGLPLGVTARYASLPQVERWSRLWTGSSALTATGMNRIPSSVQHAASCSKHHWPCPRCRNGRTHGFVRTDTPTPKRHASAQSAAPTFLWRHPLREARSVLQPQCRALPPLPRIATAGWG